MLKDEFRNTRLNSNFITGIIRKVFSLLNGVLRNTRIQIRLFIGFILLSLIPLVITGIVSYKTSSDAIQSKIQNYSSELMLQLSQNIQAELEKINATSYEMLVSKESQDFLQRYGNTDDIERSELVKNLYNTLLDRFISKKYVTAAGIIPSYGKSVFYRESIVNTFENTFMNKIIKKANDADSAPVWFHSSFGNGKKGLLVTRCYKTITFQKYLGAVFIAIDDTFLCNIYKNINLGKGADIFILDSHGMIISSKETKYTGSGYKDSSIIKAIKDNSSQNNWVLPISVNGKDTLVAVSKLEKLDWYVVGLIPFDYLNKESKSIGTKILIILLIITIFAVMFSYVFSRSISEPLRNLIKSMNTVKSGNLSIEITDKSTDEIGEVTNNFNDMLSNLRSLVSQVYKQKVLMQKAELKQLQSQINPHFLYNSFYILQKMIIIEDNANAILFSKHLANYFKFITRNAADEVSFEKEAEHARVYTDIQGIRFAKVLTIEFSELPENLKNISVPRLILQPIIENAFEHGLKAKEKNGLLRIYFNCCESSVKIIIEDNGDTLTEEEICRISDSLANDDNEKEVTAITNIHRRIRLKFGANSGLSVLRSSLGGLKVIISIELMEREGEAYVPIVDR